jgi:hypothetical protein
VVVVMVRSALEAASREMVLRGDELADEEEDETLPPLPPPTLPPPPALPPPPLLSPLLRAEDVAPGAGGDLAELPPPLPEFCKK